MVIFGVFADACKQRSNLGSRLSWNVKASWSHRWKSLTFWPQFQTCGKAPPSSRHWPSAAKMWPAALYAQSWCQAALSQSFILTMTSLQSKHSPFPRFLILCGLPPAVAATSSPASSASTDHMLLRSKGCAGDIGTLLRQTKPKQTNMPPNTGPARSAVRRILVARVDDSDNDLSSCPIPRRLYSAVTIGLSTRCTPHTLTQAEIL